MKKISLRRATNYDLVHSKWLVYAGVIGVVIFALRLQQLIFGEATHATVITWFSGFMCGILLSPTLRIWQTLTDEQKVKRDEYLDGGARKGFIGIFKLMFGRKPK